MLINHIERIEFDMDEVRRGTLIYASIEHGKKEYPALFIMFLRNDSQSCFRMRRQTPRIISSYLFQRFIKMSGK